LKKISVLIPTYNRPAFLRQALESVLNQTRLPDEIIIGDNSENNDENYALFQEFRQNHPFIKYIKNKKNIGFLTMIFFLQRR